MTKAEIDPRLQRFREACCRWRVWQTTRRKRRQTASVISNLNSPSCAIPAVFRSKQHSTLSISPLKTDHCSFWIGYSDFRTNKAFIWVIESHACSPLAKEVVSLRTNFCGRRREKSPACRRNSTRKATP